MTTADEAVGTMASGRRAPLWWVLVRNEWRLTVRDFGGGAARRALRKRLEPGFERAMERSPEEAERRRRALFILYVVVAVVTLHLVGLVAVALPTAWSDTPRFRLAAVALVLLLFTFMLSMAMSRVVTAFHERGDLDLLLSAPVAPALVLGIRTSTVAVAVAALFAVFVYPFANVGVITGHGWMGRLYLLVPVMALLCTAIALACTDAVVRLVGIRRARVGLQVFSAVVGASMYLVSQAQHLLPAATLQAWVARFLRVAGSDGAALPFRFVHDLAAGRPFAWASFVAVGAGSFAFVVWRARDRFAQVAQWPVADGPVRRADQRQVERRIARAFGRRLLVSMLLKEWRLTLRSPQLLSQILTQLLYLLPLLFVAFGNDRQRMSWSTAAFASAVVGLAGTLATSLAWLSVAAEDAPDLIDGSPQSRRAILAAKLLAAVVPPLVLVTLAALGVARRSALDAAVLWLYGVLACTTAAILAASLRAGASRGDFQRRFRGRGLAAVVEGFQFVVWAAAAGAATGGYWVVAVVLTVLALLLPAYRLRAALAAS